MSSDAAGGVAAACTPEPKAGLVHRRSSASHILDCSVGIMAYNEEANIAMAVRSILSQEVRASRIAEVIVVASGCEDRTADIVAAIGDGEPRLRLIEQSRREGKASAINLFLAQARSPVVLMVSGDVLVKDGSLDALLRHFDEPDVGMVGGHPIPVNNESSFLGYAVHLQWRLHDRIARRAPKLGEMVAFRNVVPSIPVLTAVDEISIQALITQLGYRLLYEPEAVVYNRGPGSVGELLRQRRRIHGGHLRVRAQQGYSASTMSAPTIVRAMCGSGSFSTPREVAWTLGAVGLEATARVLGRLDVTRGRSSHVWEISASTKHHIAESANADAQLNVVVFHIVNFQRLQLERGLHATRQLVRQTATQVERALGPAAIVCIRRSGTIVGVLPGERDAAERAAEGLVQDLAGGGVVNGSGSAPEINLAYGIIAFPPTGQPLRPAAPRPVLEIGPAAPAT